MPVLETEGCGGDGASTCLLRGCSLSPPEASGSGHHSPGMRGRTASARLHTQGGGVR